MNCYWDVEGRMKEKADFSEKRSRFIFQASQMPPLAHWPDRGQPFDLKKSEVCQWFMEQSWFWNWLITKAADSGAIVYDKATGKWVGSQTEAGQAILNQTLGEDDPAYSGK